MNLGKDILAAVKSGGSDKWRQEKYKDDIVFKKAEASRIRREAKNKEREEKLDQVLAVVSTTPMRTMTLSKILNIRYSTTADRLYILMRRGLIQRTETRPYKYFKK